MAGQIVTLLMVQGVYRKYKSPLFVALAAILATLFPAAGAQAQTSCPSITDRVTSTVTVGENQECTIESSGRIDVNAGGQNNVGVELSAGSTLVNRGTITADSAVIDATFGFYYGSIAARITGAGSKVINYGNIYLFQTGGVGFSVLREASNVEIEFLSGSLIAGKETGRNIIVNTQGDNTNLTFGGTALISDAANAVFFRDSWGTPNVVILLPGAAIHQGDKRPFAGLASDTGGGDDELKIGNFYDGDEPVGARTGWVHAGQWNFGITGGDTDELIVDTSPGVRFSNTGGINHYRSALFSQNAIYGLETMDIRSGNVVLGGSVYMPDGKVHIHDAGRLTFEIGKRRDAGRIGEMIISRLVADQVIFNSANYEDSRVFIQFAHYLTDSDIERFRKQLVHSELMKLDAATLASGGLDAKVSRIFVVNKVLYDQGNDLSQHTSLLRVASSGPGGIRDVGLIALDDVGGLDKGHFRLINDEAAGNIGQLQFSSVGTGPSFTGGTGSGGTGSGGTGSGGTGTGGTGTGSTSTGGGSGGGGGILVIGLLAALMGGLDLDESESELGNYYAFDRKPAKNRSGNSSYFSGLFRSERGMWVRPAESQFTSFGASYFGAVSYRMSWDLQQSGDYYLRASLSPATSVSPAGWHSSASGETLSLSGGWHRGDRRLQFGITHGRYDANAKFFDSATQGNLFGESKFRHTSVHASAVQELSGGPMKISASASLMAGQIEQAAYDAENAVMRAKVPAYRQSYTGTRLGFSAKSRKWFSLSDAVSVKPHLKVTSMHTRASVNDPVWLRQSDKVGVLSFENATVLQGVPKSLNVVGIGTDVKPSDSRGVWRLGYASMEVDGEYQHAAVAAYRMRF